MLKLGWYRGQVVLAPAGDNAQKSQQFASDIAAGCLALPDYGHG